MAETQQQPNAAPPDGPTSRRGFLTWLTRAFLGLWGLGAAGVIGAYVCGTTGEGVSCTVAERKTVVEEVTDPNAELTVDEARKIKCGERHFRDALGVRFQVVTSAKELPGQE